MELTLPHTIICTNVCKCFLIIVEIRLLHYIRAFVTCIRCLLNAFYYECVCVLNTYLALVDIVLLIVAIIEFSKDLNVLSNVL